MKFQSFALLVVLLAVFVKCEQTIVQMNLMKPIVTLNENFVSYSINSRHVLHSITTMVQDTPKSNPLSILSPGYIKVNLSPALNHDGTIQQIESGATDYGLKQMQILNEWANQNGFTMIIQVEYTPDSWRSKDALNMLGVANDYGITNCIWQLGSGKINSYSTPTRLSTYPLLAIVFYFSNQLYINRTVYLRL